MCGNAANPQAIQRKEPVVDLKKCIAAKPQASYLQRGLMKGCMRRATTTDVVCVGSTQGEAQVGGQIAATQQCNPIRPAPSTDLTPSNVNLLQAVLRF